MSMGGGNGAGEKNENWVEGGKKRKKGKGGNKKEKGRKEKFVLAKDLAKSIFFLLQLYNVVLLKNAEEKN